MLITITDGCCVDADMQTSFYKLYFIITVIYLVRFFLLVTDSFQKKNQKNRKHFTF